MPESSRTHLVEVSRARNLFLEAHSAALGLITENVQLRRELEELRDTHSSVRSRRSQLVQEAQDHRAELAKRDATLAAVRKVHERRGDRCHSCSKALAQIVPWPCPTIAAMDGDDPVEPTEQMAYIEIVFDGPPSHLPGRFVEVERPDGHGVRMGEWVERAEGYWALRITPGDILAVQAEVQS